MAQDVFQIAVEHHRAGRMRQAEEAYRAVVERNPGDAEALHGLAVLLYQAGQAGEAAELFERAAALRPQDAATHHNLAQARLGAGRVVDAVASFNRALAIEPTRTDSLVGLANAHLARRGPGDAEMAIAALRRARDAGLDTADLHHDLGAALLAADRGDEAIASFDAALARDRNYALAYHHMALAYRLKDDRAGVRRCLNKALEIDPALAQSWFVLGLLDADAGNQPQADASFRRAAKLRAAAQSAKPASGVAALEERLTPTEQAQRLHFLLAGATKLITPAQVPREQVAALFDRYAAGFDEHLTGKLGYRVPQLIASAVRDATPLLQNLDVFDLGCGTGLCGALLRWKANRLHGVDLSPAMIEQARARNVYDSLEVADLVDALRRTSPSSFDLLTAADVLNYVGDLTPVLDAAAKALRPGGLFIFTVEALAGGGGGERFELNRATHRYAHAEGYVRRVASIFGFDVRSLERTPLRREAEREVEGSLVVLTAPR